LNKNLIAIKSKVYDKLSLLISNLVIEEEGTEYDACRFQLDGLNILCRTAKITPKKTGQFVTCWRRNAEGVTAPYSEMDPIDFYVINVKAGDHFGQFVLPKSELIKRKIISTDLNDGKRGFRVYPMWCVTQNKQAQNTQQWQLNYFYEIGKNTDLKKVHELYKSS